MPERIRLRRTHGWRLPAGAVWAARPGRWGNPFTIGQCSPAEYGVRAVPAGINVYDAAHAVALYEFWATTTPYYLDAARIALTGRDLACWCPLGDPCHADWLLDAINRTTPLPVTGTGPVCKHRGCGHRQYHRGLCAVHYTDDRVIAERAVARAAPKRREPTPPDQLTRKMRWIDLARLEAASPADRWPEAGSCRGLDDRRRMELFYAVDAVGVARGRHFCRHPDGEWECPVIYDCLAHALIEGESHGVWGGCSENERGRLQRILYIRRRAAETAELPAESATG